MVIRLISLILLSVFASGVFAIPPMLKPGCKESSYDRGFRDLVHKIGVVDVDGRVAIEDLTRKGDITKAEEELLKVAVGSIHCRGSIKDKSGRVITGNVVSSAVVTGGGGPSKTLMTTAHSFFLPKVNEPVQDLTSCFFMNRAGTKIPLDLEKNDFASGRVHPQGKFALGTIEPRTDDNRDRAVVRLKSPIKLSIPVQRSGSAPTVTQKLLNVSIPHADLLKAGKFDRDSQLIGQICSVRDVTGTHTNGPINMITDCSSGPGGSGGPMLTRNSTGALVIAGLMVHGVSPTHGRTEFNIDNNHATVVGVDSEFYSEIAAVAASSRMSTAAVSN